MVWDVSLIQYALYKLSAQFLVLYLDVFACYCKLHNDFSWQIQVLVFSQLNLLNFEEFLYIKSLHCNLQFTFMLINVLYFFSFMLLLLF